MIKKTKRIKTKGGRTTLEKIIGVESEGPFISDNIAQRVEKYQGTNLKEEYKLRKDLAEDNYKIVNEQYENEGDKIERIQDRRFKYNKLHSDDFFRKFGGKAPRKIRKVRCSGLGTKYLEAAGP